MTESNVRFVTVVVGVVPDEGYEYEGDYLTKDGSSYLADDAQVAQDVNTALVGLTLDAPYTFGGATLMATDEGDTAEDAPMVAAARERTEAEIAAEDGLESDDPRATQ